MNLRDEIDDLLDAARITTRLRAMALGAGLALVAVLILGWRF